MRVQFGTLWIAGVDGTPAPRQHSETEGLAVAVARNADTAFPLRATNAVRFDRLNYRQTWTFKAKHTVASTAAGEKFASEHLAALVTAGKQTCTFYYDDGTTGVSTNALAVGRTVECGGATVVIEYTIEGDLITTATGP